MTMVLKVIVVFSLISTIQCACTGSQAILDAIKKLEEKIDSYCPKIYESCKAIKAANPDSTSGIYTINPDGGQPFDVYCDMNTDGGGWTVFQRRVDGSVEFNRNWADYEAGFGDFNQEFWLGLSKIYRLVKPGTQNTLRVEVADFEGNSAYAEYSTFNIGDSSAKYVLTIDGYSGTAGDSMTNSYDPHSANGKKFSTKDSDNDIWSAGSCAEGRAGAWWYGHCGYANLNSIYENPKFNWYYWKNSWDQIKSSEMKIRHHN